MTEALAWACSLLLLGTLAQQAYKHWKEQRADGISKFLFVGQLSASIGFTIYSALVGLVFPLVADK